MRYRQQVEQLCAMGYLDSVAVLRALAASGGDINGALDRLMRG